MKEKIKEKMIECFFYLSQAMLKNDFDEVDRLRLEIDELIVQYKNIK